LQRRFPIDDFLLLSGDIRDQVAKLSEIVPKFWCFWAAKFLTEFYKSGSPSKMWQSLMTVGQATSAGKSRRNKERKI